MLALFSSCRDEISVRGIVVDKQTRHPLRNVLIRAIRDASTSGIEFVSAKTLVNGTFSLSYYTNHLNKHSDIPLEASKEGYLANIYTVSQNAPNDTIFLERQY